MSANEVALAFRPAAIPRFRIAGLLWTVVRTDFKTRYHGTIGGFVWALLKPLTMFLVLMGVFSFIFASDPVYKLNLILGLFLWDYFAEGTRTGLLSMYAKGYLLKKARFPMWIVVVTSASNALITLAILSAVVVGFLSVMRTAPSPLELALFVMYVASMVVMVTGVSLATSVLFLRYRDLNQIWEVTMQAGFFLAPVIYPLSILPERFHAYFYVWPPTPVIQFSRSVLVQHTIPTVRAHVLLLLMTFSILCLGIAVFRRYAPRAAEYL
jgi:lipopolysaccharide transport system permease protein